MNIYVTNIKITNISNNGSLNIGKTIHAQNRASVEYTQQLLPEQLLPGGQFPAIIGTTAPEEGQVIQVPAPPLAHAAPTAHIAPGVHATPGGASGFHAAPGGHVGGVGAHVGGVSV